MADDKDTASARRTTDKTSAERLADAVEPTVEEQADQLAADRARIRDEREARRRDAGEPVSG